MGRCLREVEFAAILPTNLSFGPCGHKTWCHTHMLLPANTPADPNPLKARPTMNAVEFGAEAATTEPITKMKNDTM